MHIELTLAPLAHMNRESRTTSCTDGGSIPVPQVNLLSKRTRRKTGLHCTPISLPTVVCWLPSPLSSWRADSDFALASTFKKNLLFRWRNVRPPAAMTTKSSVTHFSGKFWVTWPFSCAVHAPTRPRCGLLPSVWLLRHGAGERPVSCQSPTTIRSTTWSPSTTTSSLRLSSWLTIAKPTSIQNLNFQLVNFHTHRLNFTGVNFQP